MFIEQETLPSLLSTEFGFWRYLTRELIWHLNQSSIRPSIYFSSIVKSRKQRGPLMGLEPTTSTLRVRRATHSATTPLIGSRKGFERDFTIELKINRGPYRRLAWISNKHSRQTKIQKPKIAKTWLTLNKYHARGSITVRDTLF